MFKAKLKKKEKELLLELLNIMSKVDDEVSQEEVDMITKIKRMYRMKKYTYKDLSKEDIREELSNMNEESVLNILTHAVLLALADDTFTKEEESLIKDYFDLLSIESAGKMQQFINEHGNKEYDVREFFIPNKTEKKVLDESLEMMQELSETSVEDIDESLLMKMRKGPVKKVWDQVLILWDTVNNPKTEKAVKTIAIGALAYLVLPTDVIPDLIPVLGLTDDVAVIAFAMSKIMQGKNTK